MKSHLADFVVFAAVLLLAGLWGLAGASALAQAQPAANPPLPAISQLMNEVGDHQKRLEKVRENYTYSSTETTQDIDTNGQVKKTET